MSRSTSIHNTDIYASGCTGELSRDRAHDNRNPPPFCRPPVFHDHKSRLNILYCKPFHVYISNMTAKPVTQPKFMGVARASVATKFVINNRNDELYVLRNEGHTSTQCSNESNAHTVNVVGFKLQERGDEQMDRLNCATRFDENLPTN